MFAENITSTKPNRHINMITTPNLYTQCLKYYLNYIHAICMYMYMWQIRQSVWNTQKLYFNLNEYVPNKTSI